MAHLFRLASFLVLASWPLLPAVAEGPTPAQQLERLGLAAVIDEPTAMFLSLRTRHGVDAGAFSAEFGRPPRGFFGDEIARLLAQSLLAEDAGGDLRLTAAGRRLSDSVFAHFVAAAD